MDKERTNFVSFREFKRGLALAGVYPSSSELRNLFNVFDKNRTGRISFEEMKETLSGKDVHMKANISKSILMSTPKKNNVSFREVEEEKSKEEEEEKKNDYHEDVAEQKEFVEEHTGHYEEKNEYYQQEYSMYNKVLVVSRI